MSKMNTEDLKPQKDEPKVKISFGSDKTYFNVSVNDPKDAHAIRKIIKKTGGNEFQKGAEFRVENSYLGEERQGEEWKELYAIDLVLKHFDKEKLEIFK